MTVPEISEVLAVFIVLFPRVEFNENKLHLADPQLFMKELIDQMRNAIMTMTYCVVDDDDDSIDLLQHSMLKQLRYVNGFILQQYLTDDDDENQTRSWNLKRIPLRSIETAICFERPLCSLLRTAKDRK